MVGGWRGQANRVVRGHGDAGLGEGGRGWLGVGRGLGGRWLRMQSSEIGVDLGGPGQHNSMHGCQGAQSQSHGGPKHDQHSMCIDGKTLQQPPIRWTTDNACVLLLQLLLKI